MSLRTKKLSNTRFSVSNFSFLIPPVSAVPSLAYLTYLPYRNPKTLFLTFIILALFSFSFEAVRVSKISMRGYIFLFTQSLFCILLFFPIALYNSPINAPIYYVAFLANTFWVAIFMSPNDISRTFIWLFIGAFSLLLYYLFSIGGFRQLIFGIDEARSIAVPLGGIVFTAMPFIWQAGLVPRLMALTFIILSGQRAPIITFLLEAILPLHKKLLAQLIKLTITILVATLSLFYLGGNLLHRILQTGGGQDSARIEILTFFYNQYNFSWFGTGRGTFRDYFAEYSGRQLPPHNLFVELLWETGIVGFTLFSISMVVLFLGWGKLRKRQSVLLASGLYGLLYAFIQPGLYNIALFTFFGFAIRRLNQNNL